MFRLTRPGEKAGPHFLSNPPGGLSDHSQPGQNRGQAWPAGGAVITGVRRAGPAGETLHIFAGSSAG